jgi:hypothetical protein
MRFLQLSVFAALSLLVTLGFARLEDTPGNSAYLPAQAAADALKSFAGTDGAFLAADQVKDGYSKKDPLSNLLAYPTDQLVIVSLSGTQLKQAFERSVSLYPEDNSSFLQISGFEVTFSKSAEPNSRVVKITVNGAPVDDHKTYTVAMPRLLGNGVLGYFKVWDKTQITTTFPNTIESILLAKKYVDTSPRWSSE